MASSSELRLLLGALALAGTLGGSTPAAADEAVPASHVPRSRSCCAFASHLSLHLGSAHVPIVLSLTGSPQALGQHSYAGWNKVNENLGLVYTHRGGFIDTGHARDFADLTAFLVTRLRPLLAAGHGTLELAPLESTRKVVVTQRVEPARLEDTTVRVARRAAFELSVWNEVVQYYASGKMPGATEVYSAFTPEDLYSNLLGTVLGARAVASPLPYDRAMDEALSATLDELGAVSRKETERTLDALEGSWWSRALPWPSSEIAIVRSFELGPQVAPLMPPADVAPRPPSGAPLAPRVLEVPQTDADGAPLSRVYRIEVRPDPRDFARYAYAGSDQPVTGADLPRIVAGIRDNAAAVREARARVVHDADGLAQNPLTHYLDGMRLVELDARVGAVVGPEARHPRVVVGGSLTAVAGDTRSGDFGFARFDLGATPERGLVAGFSLFRTNAVWFCHDPETGRLRPPLTSILGPCRPGEWLGLGGNVFEGLHDGRTGRTALRPLALYGVFNPLGNGQSASYDRVRLLVRGGGSVEHYWTERERATTLSRVGGGAVMMARSAAGRVEARGTSEYKVDPANPDDAVLQSSASLRVNFLLGGKDQARKGGVEGIDPWGVSSLGVTAGHAWATRPWRVIPDPQAPFLSAENRTSWQVLVTASLGFEGLAF